MKKFLFLLLIVIASSCAPVYIPNSRNSPMFTGKGEFQASASIGNGYTAQGALSITDNFAIMGNYMYLKRSSYDPDQPEDFRKHRIGEFGLGYFSNTDKMFFELFAGYGEGRGWSYDSYTFISQQSVSAAGNYKKYFIQPAFGFNKKVMNVSFVPRVSIIDFTQFSNGGTTYNVDEEPIVFFEPAFVGRVNVEENFFFTFQAGFSVPVSAETYYDYRALQTSIGLGVRFGHPRQTRERDGE